MNDLVTVHQGLDTRLDVIRTALVQCKDDFERLQVRDQAAALAAAACILKRKDIQVQCAELVQRAEREIAKANPAVPPKERSPGRVGNMSEQDGHIHRRTLSDIRRAHSIPDERFEEIAAEARERQEPLTRKRLQDEGRAVRQQERQEERERKQEAAVERARETPIDLPIHACKVTELHAHVEAGSLDAVFTDPPYPEEFLFQWYELGEFAAHALKPGGVLIALSGQMFLDEVFKRLDAVDEMEFRWLGAYVYRKPRTRIFARKITNGWKPFVIYTRKGASPARSSEDVFHAVPATDADKAEHEWGQTETDMEAIAREWLEPGWRIADPFCGAGSLLAAARRMGCEVMGGDVNPAFVQLAKEKINGL